MMTIEDLDLDPIMELRATELQVKYPTVVYISGRRGAGDQAYAMAGNHIEDPEHYLVKTYARGKVFLEAVLKLPVSFQENRFEVAHAIHHLLVTEPGLLDWKHKHGTCVDLQRMEDERGHPNAVGTLVIDWIRACPDTVFFTMREGGLSRWHWECRKQERTVNV